MELQTNNFQSESKRSGDEFEDIVHQDLKDRGFTLIKKNVIVEEAGCEVDFVAYAPHMRMEYIEAKGGKAEGGKRPGAQRTDNVKKAIANASLIKAIHPQTYFVAYFSAKPITGSSSDKMIHTALCHKILDEVRYITNRVNTAQLDLFIEAEKSAAESRETI